MRLDVAVSALTGGGGDYRRGPGPAGAGRTTQGDHDRRKLLAAPLRRPRSPRARRRHRSSRRPGPAAVAPSASRHHHRSDDHAARALPVSIAVSGLPKGITDVNVTLDELRATSIPDDVDVLLVGPTGGSVVLMSDAGGGLERRGVNLTFDDEASGSAARQRPDLQRHLQADELRRLAIRTCLLRRHRTSRATTLADFDGTDPNGTWSLYVVDDVGIQDVASFDGWSLQITTVDVPAAPMISTPTNGLDSDGDFIVAGTAQAGSTVKVYEGTTLLSQTTASATGTWALALLDQGHGVHAYIATATDAFGNVSAPSAVKTVAVDTVHPRVIRTRPAAGADEVRRGRNVRAFFSEPVRPVTIVGANVKLVRVATGATVRARLRYDADTKSVVINPRNDLAANARYKVVIGTGVRDLAGNRLDQNTAKSGNQAKVWRFTTR